MDVSDWVGGAGGYFVHDAMLRVMDKCFGRLLLLKPVEWLTDNSSAYTADVVKACSRGCWNSNHVRQQYTILKAKILQKVS